MNDWLRLTVEGQPRPKGRPRALRQCPGCGRKLPPPYTPKDTKDHERHIANAGRAQLATPLSGDLAVWAGFWRADARRVDSDNLLKSATDALEGVAYENDAQICDAWASRRIDRERPRTEIEIVSVSQARALYSLKLESF